MALQRMDHVGVVVDDLEAANGLDGVRADIAMMRTPDGHGRLELTKFRAPAASAEPAPRIFLSVVTTFVSDLSEISPRN